MEPALFASIFMLLASGPTAYASEPAYTSSAGASPAATAMTTTATQPPVPPPRTDATIKRILATMDEASTDGHPDLFGQFAGMRRLFKSDYKGAMKYFKIGARFADKLSQISIGMMYLHGRGVSKDPASACAWVTLAAERSYPSYVSARDQICAALTAAQHDQAMAMLDTLKPEYGDAIAMRRMKLQLTNARREATGSMLGHDSGIRTMALESNPVNCGGYRLALGGVEVPARGCGRYDPDLYDSKKYFAARDAQWYGTVTVGPLTKVTPPLSDADKPKSDQP